MIEGSDIEPTSIVLTRLDNIEANLKAIRARLDGQLVLAAVKADAYGHGAIAVAQMMQETKTADWLGVATVAEGLELRAADINLPILKLSMTRHTDETEAAVSAAITLTVTDTASIVTTAAAAAARGVIADVHLKIDTGMNRIGCPPADAVRLAKLIDDTASLHLSGVFSHLPVSDSPSGDAVTRTQIKLFADTCDAIEQARGPVKLKHLANSGAILAHPDSWFDMVRPGIMIYGAYPDPDCPHTVALRPGMEWSTYLSFVKTVSAGSAVSYGGTWVAPADTRVGTIPIGYADGYSRALSNRGRVLVNGRSCPVIGRVCMDQAMIDLGPDSDAVVGDEVILIGGEGDATITTTEVAELMGTIPYEMTCLISPRVARGFSS